MNVHTFTARTGAYLRAVPTGDLVLRHKQLKELCRHMDAEGNDVAAQIADERAQAVSAELRDRLEQWLGNVPVAEFMEAL